MLIFIMVDLFENLDRFIDKKLTILMLIQYYTYFIPDILKLITPVGMLLASLFTISRFVNYSEMTAMKSAGISIYRYLLPVLTFGLIITLFAVYFNGWIVPHSNRLKYKFEREVLGRNTISNSIQNIYIQDKINRIIIINNYEKSTQTCSNTSIQIFNKDTLTNITVKLDIVTMKWDFDKKDWEITTAYLREFSGIDKETLKILKDVYLSSIPNVEKVNL
ncbi:MAG: LptF/LptG family permease, partial [Bacteroidetes bacterium]|nr:LptF/LptG family permease [Bacteroidota bacterium]